MRKKFYLIVGRDYGRIHEIGGKMNELALFAGVGGGILGGHLLGWRTVCAVESDPYAIETLCHRQNDSILSTFPIWDDINTFEGSRWRGSVDLVSGGFPCQAFSTAARGRNIAHNLWPEMQRVISEVNPQFIFVENVSGAKTAMEQANGDLERMGYITSGVFSFRGEDCGAPHRRLRLWIVGYSNDGGKSVVKKHEEAPWLQKSTKIGFGQWPSIPNGSGMDDGSSSRMDRQRTIGNAQVPRVAAAAFIEGIKRMKEKNDA